MASWPDEIDEILAGDAVAGFSYLTPAKGAVVSPMAPLGLRDRAAGTVTVSTSQGLWKKLARIRRNPSVAIAYHAREHGFSERPEFVLVQGEASFPKTPDRAWLESIEPQWERFLGKRKGGLRDRWLDVYYWRRVPITIAVSRVIAWPDLRCAGEPAVHGAPLPAPPVPQSPPKNGTAPRVDAARLTREAEKLPHVLLAWAGGDGKPMVVPVGTTGSGPDGAVITAAPGLLPAGGRRAGLTSHWFEPRMIGQEQRIYTGWLDVDGERALYAPHTRSGYRLPASELLFTVAAGAGTRAGIGKARKQDLAA